jgi:hypothetical protein
MQSQVSRFFNYPKQTTLFTAIVPDHINQHLFACITVYIAKNTMYPIPLKITNTHMLYVTSVTLSSSFEKENMNIQLCMKPERHIGTNTT